jgi:hypothetical protein
MELNPNQKLILRDLEFGFATAEDLAAAIGICGDAARQNLNKLHKAGLVRIAGWENRTVRVWGLKGEQKDVRRPKPLTQKDWKTKWRLNNREIHNACARRFHMENRGREKEKSRQWRLNNPEKVKAYRMRKRAQRSFASTTQISTSLSGI